jgi:ABC-type lipoprotein release transport system permease subunit
VHPPILEGRRPSGPGEIALGRRTLRSVDARVGDTVRVGFQGSTSEGRFRVVGVTVLPVSSDVSALGEGMWGTLEGLGPLFGDVPIEVALVRFSPRANADSIEAGLREAFGPEAVRHADLPGTVVDFGRVSNMPYVLASVVGLLAAGTLAHGLVTAVGRRRRDLSILRTLGLDRRQVRRVVASQATVTAFLTLAAGLPCGIIVGRWVWAIFARQTGFVAQPDVDLVVLAATIPAAVLLANLIAALPARSAARTQPALVLRTE